MKPEHVKDRFPKIYSTCLQYDLDITADLLPVRPAAHYAMGGVATDLNGAASLEGLFAAGEVASTGVHGANRLASNSLLEGLVFGARAGASIRRRHRRHRNDALAAASQTARACAQGQPQQAPSARQDAATLVQQVREILWNKVGIIRDQEGLAEAVGALGALCLAEPLPLQRNAYEAQNILTVGRLIAASAMARRESRGAHYRADIPFKESSEPRHSFVSRDSSVEFCANLPEPFAEAAVAAKLPKA